MAKRKKHLRVGLLTGGGDCPGLNAVIRAVVKDLLHEHDAQIVGFLDGYEGLVLDRSRPLGWNDASSILTLGGTILGTSNTANPMAWAERRRGKMVVVDRSADAVRTFKKHRLDGLIVIGGDGSMAIAGGLIDRGIPVVGVPKTIDNDVPHTDRTFGFQTAVDVATDALDRLHTTANSHHRVMVAEVMGRYAGWLALESGIASGTDIILIPEIPFRWESIAAFCLKRYEYGKRFTIVCVAEGAKPVDGEMIVRCRVEGSPDPIRLGGIGAIVASRIEQDTGIEARATTLGYIQRGGSPCPFDRVFATSLGYQAAELAAAGRWGRMASWKDGRLTDVALVDVAGGCRKVTLDHPLLAVARSVGTGFGE